MKTPKAQFHCSDCARDFKTKAALVAHEHLAAVHNAPLKKNSRSGELLSLSTPRRIDPDAVKKLRDGGMPWREIAKRLGGVSLGGVRHAYGADKRSNHHARKENALTISLIGADGETVADVERGILTAVRAQLEEQRVEIVAKQAALDLALKAFPEPKNYR